MTIRVLQPGMFTTVQDLGRPGLGPMGVPRGGAMDEWSMRLANRLVGNPEHAAGLEFTLVGPELLFETEAVIALTGSEFARRLDREPDVSRVPAGDEATRRIAPPSEVPHGASFRVLSGSRLRLGRSLGGARGYLAVQGGIGVPAVLGSRSTLVAAGFGGHEGRPLQSGDRLAVETDAPTRVRRRIATTAETSSPLTLRVIQGPQGQSFTEEGWRSFYTTLWRVSPKSDRMGVRLEGPEIGGRGPADIPPQGVPPGAIQVPADGRPIVLGPEGPVTGGYSQIATVISVDLCKVAQLKPGETVLFEMIDPEEARVLWRGREEGLRSGRVVIPIVDLNADVGEGCDDAALLSLVSSVNVACGGHAGDRRTMEETIEAAHRLGLSIGAHPGYPDRANFGRRELDLSLEDVTLLVVLQTRALAEAAATRGARVSHVKPHGALYNQAARDPRLADAIAAGVREVDPSLRLVGLAGSALIEAGRRAGLETVAEAFADRRYRADGSLAPRSVAGAVIVDPHLAAAQALAIVRGDPIATLDGAWITLAADTICLHGDTPGALAIAREVRAALGIAGIEIRAIA